MIEKGDLSKLKDIQLFLFDMDGTLYLGYDLFPFTIELLKVIKEQGKRYLFMTNNSSKSPEAYIEKMKKLGIETEYGDFITASQATVNYINTNLSKKKLYVLGTKSFREEIREDTDVIVYEDYSDDIEGVVMGFDTELTFKKLDDVSKLLTLHDIPYIAANPDLVCPTEYGYVPDCGSVAKMIFNATGKEPYFIGKPRPEMPLFAIERTKKENPNITKENTMVIGDRMYTDIACGINAKIKTMLVLSGETTEEQAKNTDYDIDYIVKDCGRLLEILKK